MYETFEKEHNVNNIYRTTRNLLNWKSGGSPQSFLIDGKWFRRPVDFANLQQE